MIKKDELKLKINKAADKLIDIYFSNNTIIESMANSTLKIIVKNNMDKVDEVLCLFADKDGYIDETTVISTYANQIGDEGINFDIKDYIKSDFLRNIMPNKSLIIHKNDLMKIMCIENGF